MSIQLTENAVNKVRAIMSRENIEGGLRLGVQGGGCSGLTYSIRFEPGPGPKDQIFDFEGVKVYVDPKSYIYLQGVTVDYHEGLMEHGFRFVNPNAKKDCGCGTSFTA